MKQVLQKRLVSTYSDLFEQTEEPITSFGNIRFYGFQCQDGWYDLINTLLKTIQFNIKYNKCPKIIIKGVKEKFGTLDFYYSGGDRLTQGLVNFATHMSRKICEYCGTNQNVGRTKGWISVLCEDCHDRIDNRKDLIWIPNDNRRLLKLEKIKSLIDAKYISK